MAEAAKRLEPQDEAKVDGASERRGSAVARAALVLIRREDVVLRPAPAKPVWIALRDLRW